MKRSGQLWNQICTFSNALDAYDKARFGKRHAPEVVLFESNREENLLRIISDLKDLSYKAGSYTVFKIFEPKERIIMALPFRDRVVQHMICNCIEPIFERRFYEHSYACRKGKGMHAASDTLQRWIYNLEIRENKRVYALKCDIHHYFQNINHEKLKAEIRRYLKDKNLLAVLDQTISHNGIFPDGVGIPVGNLTSQLFANVYLTVLDDYIKNELHCKYYIRYMDDFIILSDDPQKLRELWKKLEVFLINCLKLELNPKTTIVSAKNGVDFVGYKHFSRTRKIRKGSLRRMRKLFKDYNSGKVSKNAFLVSFVSRVAHMEHADTFNLVKRYKEEAKRILERNTSHDTREHRYGHNNKPNRMGSDNSNTVIPDTSIKVTD